jgi:hypothetical protein
MAMTQSQLDAAWDVLVQRVNALDAPKDALKGFYSMYGNWAVAFSATPGGLLAAADLAKWSNIYDVHQNLVASLEATYNKKPAVLWPWVAAAALGAGWWLTRRRRAL